MTAPVPFPLRRVRPLWLACLATSVITLVAGCKIIPEPAPDPTRFFVLTGPGLPSSTEALEGTLRLGLHPVELPAYLKSRSLVVRNGRNEVVYDDFSRWAEPLDDGIARVLRARLTGTATVSRVYAHPFPFDRERDYDISVTVIRCEGTREATESVARFAAVVEIIDAKKGTVVSRRVVVAPDVPWDGGDRASLVEALSESVGHLANEVVAQLPDARPASQ